jgi:hypothetical protein
MTINYGWPGAIQPSGAWPGAIQPQDGGGASVPMAIFRRPMRFFKQMR